MFDNEVRPVDHFPEPVTHDQHGARSIACPSCHAKPGEPCHPTSHGSEVHVHRDHQARLDAFHAAQGAERPPPW